MKITLFIYEKVRGLAHWCGALRIFMFSQSRHELCCQPLPSPHTQYCICTRWRMMKGPGDGSGSEVNSRIIRSFHFYIQARILSEWTQWTRGLLHISYTQAFTSLLGIYMEGGNWFEMIWTSSDARHPGLSLSSLLIIKCKSLAPVSEVFNFMECFIEASDRAKMTSPVISRGALPI